MKFESLAIASALCAFSAQSAWAEDAIKVPKQVRLPELTPLVSLCADPAADHFLEVDISQRPPAGAARVQRLGAWVTSDGMLHWPFVMRIRNISDQPFMGEAGKQRARVVEKDLAVGGRERTVATSPFDRIDRYSGLAVRFEFAAPAKEVEKGKFHRIYTLDIQYDKLNETIVNSKNGDCNLRNNSFAIEFDGKRPAWIYGK